MRVTGLVFALLIPALAVAQTPPAPEPVEEVRVFFSPAGGCTEAVVRELNKAQGRVYVQAYSFTSAPIAKALLEAHKRGVDVEIILDKSNKTERYSAADLVANAGIPTFIDSAHAIAHNKIVVIDEHVVLTGSFNLTSAAEHHNAENLLVLTSRALAQRYLENWENHLKHSKPYTRQNGPRNPTTSQGQ